MDYDKIYIGTVIRSSDTVVAKNNKAGSPQGKVLVKIEGISQTNKNNEDYKFPLGKNIPGGVSDENVVLLEGHEIEAYVLSPVVGGDSPGRYYDKPPKGKTGGTATFSETHDVSLVSNKDNGTQGGSIANQFAKGKPDGFTGKPDVIGTAGVNTYGKFYQVNYKDGQSTGSFAIPGVGARVLISFINGSRALPIVIGALHGGPAVAGINSSAGAPNVYPNYPNHANVRRPQNK
jgi:hypothetical protein